MVDLLVYLIETQKYAVNLKAVESIISVVSMTRIPNAPETIMGAINKHGQVLPVVNMRKIFDHPQKEIEISDQMVICHIGKESFALYVDDVIGVMTFEEKDFTGVEDVCPDLECVESVIKKDDDLILVYNPNNLEKIAHFELTGAS